MYCFVLQVFCDFLPGTVFADSTSLVLRQQLGDGGFGTVYRATLHTRVRTTHMHFSTFLAVKKASTCRE